MKDNTLNGVRHLSSRDERILRNIIKAICGDCCFPIEYCDRCRVKLAIEDTCKALEEIRNKTNVTVRLPAELAFWVFGEMSRGEFPKTGTPETQCSRCSLIAACQQIGLGQVGCYSGWRWEVG